MAEPDERLHPRQMLTLLTVLAIWLLAAAVSGLGLAFGMSRMRGSDLEAEAPR